MQNFSTGIETPMAPRRICTDSKHRDMDSRCNRIHCRYIAAAFQSKTRSDRRRTLRAEVMRMPASLRCTLRTQPTESLAQSFIWNEALEPSAPADRRSHHDTFADHRLTDLGLTRVTPPSR